jgi:soluble lytic murein transglycosylase-like protein
MLRSWDKTMSKILIAVLLSGAVISSPAHAKKDKSVPAPECPVDTIIRTASPQLLKNFSVLSGCKEQVVVAEAEPEEFAPEEEDAEGSEQASLSSDRWSNQYAIEQGSKSTVASSTASGPAFAIHRDASNLNVNSVSVDQVSNSAPSGTYSVRYSDKNRKRAPYAGTGAIISITPPAPEFPPVNLPAQPAGVSYDFTSRVAIYNEPALAASGGLSGNAILSMRPQTYRTQFDTIIADTANRRRIDPLFLHAVIKQESGYRATVASHAGARGLMQIMPATGRSLGVDPSNLTNASINVDAGARLLRKLYYKYNGNFDLVLAAYNAGEGAVQKYGNRIPPYRETQNYVRSVMAIYNKLLAEQNAMVAAK